MNKDIRVLIADDRELTHGDICRILSDRKDVKIVAQATDSDEAVLEAIRTRPDIAVIDLTMPRLHGLDAVERIHNALPKCRVLVLTAHYDDEYVLPVVRAGASGYLRKETAPAELGEAIDALSRGEVYFDPEAVKILATQLVNE